MHREGGGVEVGGHGAVGPAGGADGLHELAEDRDGPAGPAELPADEHRLQPADGEENQPQKQELEADDLVVGREDVLLDEPDLVVLVAVGVVQGVFFAVGAVERVGDCGHKRARWERSIDLKQRHNLTETTYCPAAATGCATGRGCVGGVGPLRAR